MGHPKSGNSGVGPALPAAGPRSTSAAKSATSPPFSEARWIAASTSARSASGSGVSSEAGTNRKIKKGCERARRKIVAAIAAAFDVLEAEIPALGTLHGSRHLPSPGAVPRRRGARAISCFWISARSRSASGFCGSVGRTRSSASQRIAQTPRRNERTRPQPARSRHDAEARVLPQQSRRETGAAGDNRGRSSNVRQSDRNAPAPKAAGDHDDQHEHAERHPRGARSRGVSRPAAHAAPFLAAGVRAWARLPCSSRLRRSRTASASSGGAP